jgi:hypothetical protein
VADHIAASVEDVWKTLGERGAEEGR